MNVIYTVLVALPLGVLLPSRSTAILTYLLVGSYLFSFQSTNLVLDWLGHSSPSAFGPFPDDFPAVSSNSAVFGYGVVNATITLAGVGLVLLGARLRRRRAAKREVVAVG
ncbi:MAG TPA: hypothetical protein VFL99_11050 [Segeticoccus sp.]|uniref:hypothetical protein n=1 Tax=Segeticoccus sp. TaxID=2706531 RepID=UPI002D7E64C8|nr:hypothetical protein [Segeticoccus sp.]HET8600855.1 hypothetical protein [Segeticoccus sp.]